MSGITPAQRERLSDVLIDLAPRDISKKRLVSVVSNLLEQLHQAQATIDQKYNNLGGAPGKPTTDIEFGGEGYYRRYEQGAIYLHPQSGAYWVHGAIYEKYTALGGEAGFLGYPLTDETRTPDGIGRYNHFQGGSIYWTDPTGAHEIHGAIRDKWASLGWESFFGYPTTDEIKLPDGVGRLNHFQSGSIYWTPNTGAWEVHGAIRDKWGALGWQTSYLGYPTADEMPWTHPNTKEPGRISAFERGMIAWTSHFGAFDLPDTIILSSRVNPPEPISGWAELIINSRGGFCYRGHLHDSGGEGYHIAVASALNFQDSEGHVFVATEEGNVNGTFTYGSRDHNWENVGFEQLLRDNFNALRFCGMSTTLKVNVSIQDVVENVLKVLPISGVITLAVFVVSLFASDKAKMCPPITVQRIDPETGQPHQEAVYPILGSDEPCPSTQ